MRGRFREALSDRVIWFLVGFVFLGVLGVLMAVFAHEKEKPQSPQAMVAAAFGQMFQVQEWKPGMGKQPFAYHPAGFNSAGLVWRPLPSRSPTGQVWHSLPGRSPTGQ